MSRWLRLAIVVLTLTLTSLILDTQLVGAKWVRLGASNEFAVIERICKDGFTFVYANVSIPVNGTPIPVNQYKIGTTTSRSFYVKYYTYKPSQYELVSLVKQAPDADSYFTSLVTVSNLNDYYEPTTGYPTPLYKRRNIHVQFSNTSYPYIVLFTPNDLNYYQTAGWIENPGEIEDCLLFSNPGAPNFTDSRVDAYEPWESVAAYCEDKMVKVYGIDASGNGYFAFAVTQADIDKLGIPTENTLLASFPSAFGGKIRLYKLQDTGELQINAPGLPPDSWKEYVFTWAGCA